MKYGGIIGRAWWIVLAVLVVTLAVTAAVTSRVTPVYRSSAQLVVAPSAELTDPADVLRALETLERRTVIATFARIPATRETRAAVAKASGLAAAEVRRYDIEGSVLPSTNIVRISVEGPDPARAAAIADTAARITSQQAGTMYRSYTLRPMTAAHASSEPVRPNPRRNYLVAVAVGLMVGLAAAFALEHIRTPPAGS